MRITERYGQGRPVFSFEFFPPKTDRGFTSLFRTVADLKRLDPDFVSVTWGAGGSTRQKTVELIKTVLGPAATKFLFAALESIPKVSAYLQEVDGKSPLPPAEFVKALREAPAYLRVLVYVAEANDEGHAITGAHIAFPVGNSESITEWLDTMLADLFGEKAQENPFSSTERHRVGTEAPLDVEADYEKDLATAESSTP